MVGCLAGVNFATATGKLALGVDYRRRVTFKYNMYHPTCMVLFKTKKSALTVEIDDRNGRSSSLLRI
jgi:hypothetical protein